METGSRPIAGPDAGGALDAWERRLERATCLVPYALLVASTAFAGLDGGQPAGSRLLTLGLAAGATAWMLWFTTLHPGWAERRGAMGLYCAGLLALVVALTLRSAWFGLFAFTGYLHAWRFLHGAWKFAGIAVTALVSSVWVLEAFARPSVVAVVAWLAVAAFIVALVSLFSRQGDVTAEQSRQRKEMIAELAEANRRLEATLEENAGLHAQLLAQAREAGVLDERQRMAREMHDTIAQGLTGVITQVQAAEQAADRPPDWRRHLDNAARLARESLAEARRSVRAIGPEPLAAARLPEALAEIAGRWSGLHGVPAEPATAEARRRCSVGSPTST